MARQARRRGLRSSRPEVADRLHSAAIHLLRRVRQVDQAGRLGPARLSALSVVVFAGPVTLGQLAEAEQVTPATISRLVKGLEHARLVTRRSDPGDGRVTWLEPTAKGKELLFEGRRRRVAYLRALMEPLAESQVALLSEAAEVIEGLTRGPARAAAARRRARRG
jgi:DNA-binding MarR family transcriptional regulator